MKPRLLLIVLCAAVATGCASNAAHESAQTPPNYEDAQAAALAFDSPVRPDYALPGLEREPRQPWAFAGFEDSVMEIYGVSISDMQSTNPWNNEYDRWTVSQKVGVRYR